MHCPLQLAIISSSINHIFESLHLLPQPELLLLLMLLLLLLLCTDIVAWVVDTRHRCRCYSHCYSRQDTRTGNRCLTTPINLQKDTNVLHIGSCIGWPI